MAVSVLVLEDDDELRTILAEALEDAGYFTQGAPSAEEALKLARRFKFELVIADVRMAGPRDGLGVLEVLKERKPDLKCIVITGYADEEAPKRAVRIVVDDYVYKPFGLDDLLETVRKVMRGGQERASYRDLLGTLLAAPRKLLAKAEAARRAKAEKALENDRARCVQGLFVGIRSNMLSRGAALDAWDRLEKLDLLQERLDGAGVAELQELGDQYRQLFELLTAMARSQAVGSHGTRGAGQVERAAFHRLYDKIRASQVSPEQLQVASSLRRAAPSARSSPELTRLHTALWG